MKGEGQKVWYVPRNSGKTNFLAGCPEKLAGKFRGAPNKFEDDMFSLCSTLAPKITPSEDPFSELPGVTSSVQNYERVSALIIFDFSTVFWTMPNFWTPFAGHS